MKIINSFYFVGIFIASVLMLLPKKLIYFGYAWTIIGSILLFIVFLLIPITLMITAYHDVKNKKWKSLSIRIAALSFGICIWYLHKYVFEH